MGKKRINHRHVAHLKELADKNALKNTSHLKLGIVSKTMVTKNVPLESKESEELRDLRSLETRALRLLSPKGAPWHPLRKPNYLMPPYAEENRAISRSAAEKLPYPKPGKPIHFERWKAIGGGKGT